MTEPLVFDFEVACSQAAAFSTWTQHASTWWPADHSVSGERGITVIFEDHEGGRVFERTSSGVEHDWGQVTAWDPPSRLAFTWHLHFAAAEATDVEIRFVALGQDRTRVEIEHRGWERLGDGALQRREGNQRGWESVLPYFMASIGTGVA